MRDEHGNLPTIGAWVKNLTAFVLIRIKGRRFDFTKDLRIIFVAYRHSMKRDIVKKRNYLGGKVRARQIAQVDSARVGEGL